MGKTAGLLIWRIENFHIVPWKKEHYGQFYDGDSYIILNTFKKAGEDKLYHDVHFWLGLETTQDEAGTGMRQILVYKTHH